MTGNQVCPRCGNRTWATILSAINADMICLDCKRHERKQHPRLKENRLVVRGDYDYPGKERS